MIRYMTFILNQTQLKLDIGLIFELLVNFAVLSNDLITMIMTKMNNSCVHILFSCLISNYVFVFFHIYCFRRLCHIFVFCVLVIVLFYPQINNLYQCWPVLFCNFCLTLDFCIIADWICVSIIYEGKKIK